MVIGGVANVYYSAQVTNPSAITAAVAAVQASRPDLTDSDLAGQVAQQLAAQQRALIATGQDVSGIAGAGGLDIYA